MKGNAKIRGRLSGALFLELGAVNLYGLLNAGLSDDPK